MPGPNLLNNVSESETFNVINGVSLKNLNDLKKLFKNINQETFSHHVREGRNDFADWVKYSIGDNVLADRLQLTSKADEMYKVIYERLHDIKHVTEKIVKKKEVKPHQSELWSGLIDFLLGLVVGFGICLLFQTLIP
jgi:hypothetical protein